MKLFLSSCLVLAMSSTLSAQSSSQPSLAPELQKIAEGAAKRFPPQVLETFKQAMQTVKSTGIETSAKQIGDTAPDATLNNWKGETVQLSQLWKQGPVVLMWYRGGWCPYCNIQLRAMQKSLDAIEDAGARLIVLSPELPDKAKATAEANDLNLVALHDENSAVAKQYGIVFDLPETIVPMYRDKLQLGSYNGNDAMELPLAATYVINTSGEITYAFLDANYTLRAEPAEVVAAVKAAL